MRQSEIQMNEDVAAHQREESLIRSYQEKEEEEERQRKQKEEEERLRKQKEEEERRWRKQMEEEEERLRKEKEKEDEEERERLHREAEEAERERRRRETEEREERRTKEEEERKQIAEEQAKRVAELEQRRERRARRLEEEKNAKRLEAERREAERQKHKEERERNMQLRETRRLERKAREAERKRAEEELRQQREEERRRRSENRPERPTREMLEEYRTKDRWVDFQESDDEPAAPVEKKQPEIRKPSLPPAPPSEGVAKNPMSVSVTEMLRTSYMPTRQTSVEEYQDAGEVAKSTVFAYPQYGDYRKQNRESIEGAAFDESVEYKPEEVVEQTHAEALPEEAEEAEQAEEDSRPEEIKLDDGAAELGKTLSTTMIDEIPSGSVSPRDASPDAHPKPEGVVSVGAEDEEGKQNESDQTEERSLSCSAWGSARV